MSNKNYYNILEITDEEKNLPWDEFVKVVKKNYRRLSQVWHPDKHCDDTEEEAQKAEERFREINEAYEVLSDQQKKSQYDNPMPPGFDFMGGMNPFDIFGGFNPFGNRQRAKERQGNVGSSIRISLGLTIEEIYTGVEKTIKYKRQEPCDTCNGSGLGDGGSYQQCPVCHGTGMEIKVNGYMQQMSTCRNCGGSGTVATKVCDTCHGSGMKTVDHEITIKIPKGIHDGMELVMQGEGCLSNHKDGIPGDLYIVIREEEGETFVRRGDDIYFQLQVPVITAIMGGSLNVTTIDGKTLKADIPNGTEEGKHIRFSGKGIPVYGKEGRFGHMIGITKIMIPESINDEERRILSELKEQEHFNVSE